MQRTDFGVEYTVGPNIGDGIYQLSVAGLMRMAFPGASVVLLDGPSARTFPPRPAGLGKYLDRRRYSLLEGQRVETLVLSGPIISETFLQYYGEAIRRQIASGGRYALVSVHAYRHQPAISKFLNDYPPAAIATRDSPSVKHLYDVKAPIYDGVCASLLSSSTIDVPGVSGSRYVTVSFYQGLEPRISFRVDAGGHLDLESVAVGRYRAPKVWRIGRHFQWLQQVPGAIGDHSIVRPVHDIGYKFSHLNSALPNAFLSYNPVSYLSLYKSTALTISDRVHSCAPTLAFGRPALLVGSTPRSAIFDRIGANAASGIMRVPAERLKSECESLRSWLAQTLAA
jgi:hypothetical protein